MKPGLARGYLGKPHLTAERFVEFQGQLMYRTGDLVEASADGCLRIIGRRNDSINVGGRKVHPVEIEQVIAEIEGVDACLVFGRADAIAGNVIGCRIVTRLKDDPRAWKRRIRAHCRGRLADWKIPVTVELSDELTLTQRLKRGCSGTTHRHR